MYASNFGDLDSLRLLLERKADTERKNIKQETALYIAAANDRASAVGLLLEHGAAVDARVAEGWTSLMIAVRLGHREVVLALTAAGADVNAKNSAGLTALHIAAWHGKTETAEILLERKADPNARSDKGETALEFALKQVRLDCAELLLRKGAVADESSLESLNRLREAALRVETDLKRHDEDRKKGLREVFHWRDGDFADGDETEVGMIRSENRSAIAWFEAQNFPPIPTFAGEKGAADYCFDLAVSAKNSGVVKEAWAGFHQALRRFAAMGDEKMTGLACFNLGQVYGTMGDWPAALLMFRQSAFFAAKVGDEKGLAWSLYYLGDVCVRQGDKAEGRDHWLRAKDIFGRISPENARNLEKALAGI